MNSINHKRYEGNNPIQISIYDDKIYVWNDALFPEELKNKNLFEKHYSKPYNPLIAQTFFKAGFIESWGRGFEKIKDECEKYNVPLPGVEINSDGVMIKCVPSKTYIKVLNGMNSKNSNFTNDFTNGFTNDFTNDSADDFTDVEIKILDAIRGEPSISQVRLSEKIGVSKRTITNNMNSLQKRQIIKRVGNKRNGYWEIQK